MRKLRIILGLMIGLTNATADIVDSLVASVGTIAIKHSDVMREIRMAALINHEKPNFNSAAQKDAVNRLIDQALIRQEINQGMYIPEDPRTAESMLEQLRKTYGGQEPFTKTLNAAEISEDELKKQLQWQASVLKFVQLRFGGGESGTPSKAVNDEFFAWLDQMRDKQNVQIKEARLQ